ncbi:MAG TPA: MdtA/MuxA family multidrug efflux RND transporter periplasmic adaptor subunit [Nitrobacter sp.]|nr:MdtA/MuxA family multidrug efflux RND transporter periplasmic adaptor subunit [Nitrobacter sp.]
MDQPVKPFQTPQPVETPPVAQRKPRHRLTWFILLILLLAAGALWWRHHEQAPHAARNGRVAQPMSVATGTVGKGDIGISLNALGTVTSLATVTVRTQISGYLMKIDFKEGDEVKKGDLLAEIDPRPYQAALAQANGNLTRDQALLKGAQVDLTRYQGLAAQNAVPHQTLDTQVALVAQYQGTVEADRAAVQAAQVNLQYCHIVSPIDGRVGLRQVDQGNYVTPGDTNGLVVITQLHPISVLFTVPEDNLQAIAKRLQAGATLPATAYDRSDSHKIADGTLQTFDSQIDATTGTIKLRALFPNEARTLYPNQFVNIRLLVDTHSNVDVMPTAGVQRGVPGTFVYLVNPDSTVSVRKVSLGVTDGQRVEVLSGLSPGDRMVIDGADKLRDGAKVVVRAEPADSSTNPTPNNAPGQKQRPDNGQKK